VCFFDLAVEKHATLSQLTFYRYFKVALET
jgi:hypothetical protein